MGDHGRPDVVHLFQPFLAGLLLWARQTRRPGVVGWYDWDDLWAAGGLMANPFLRPSLVGLWQYLWVSSIERHLPPVACGVTTCSHWLAGEAERRGATRAVVIPNGFWPGALANREAARRTLGLDPDAYYVGFMGRTLPGAELDWCLDALADSCPFHPRLRLAVCGVSPSRFAGVEGHLRGCVDALGVISPEKAELFAQAIDLGLVPMEDSPFNRSRFPIRFAHFLAANTPVLCSEVGDLATYAGLAGVVPAGSGRDQWIRAFHDAIDELAAGRLRRVDSVEVQGTFSWAILAKQLEACYLALS
jgi:glycosyltransferase involved in cell wall biosynthesis